MVGGINLQYFQIEQVIEIRFRKKPIPLRASSLGQHPMMTSVVGTELKILLMNHKSFLKRGGYLCINVYEALQAVISACYIN